MREAFAHLRTDYTVDELVTIANHESDGYTNPYTTYRQTYCAVSGYPTAMVDYIYKLVGTYTTWQQDYAWLSPNIDSQLAKTAPCTLDITYDVKGGGGNTTGDYYAVAFLEKGDGNKEVVQTKQIALSGVTDPSDVVLHTTVTLDTDLTGSYKLWMVIFEEPVTAEYHWVARVGTHPPINLTISGSGETVTYDWSNGTNAIQPTSLGHIKSLFQ